VNSVTGDASGIWRDILDAHQRRMLAEIAPGSIVYLDSFMPYFHLRVKLQ
jgi:hypothetical protein